MIDKKQLFLEGSIVIPVIVGIVLDVITSGSLYDQINLFTYFTIQTNLLLGLSAFYSIVRQERTGYFSTLFRISTTVWITVTGTSYSLLLAKYHHPKGLYAIANILLHYVTPVMSFIAFIVIKRKERLRWYTPFLMLIYPLIYFVLTMIRGEIDSYYPYWFLNPKDSEPEGVSSYKNVLKYLAMMVTGVTVIGYIFVAIYKIINKNSYNSVKA